MRVCPSIGRSVRRSVRRSPIFFNRGIQAKMWSNFHQCPCPTCVTDAAVYTALFKIHYIFFFKIRRSCLSSQFLRILLKLWKSQLSCSYNFHSETIFLQFIQFLFKVAVIILVSNVVIFDSIRLVRIKIVLQSIRECLPDSESLGDMQRKRKPLTSGQSSVDPGKQRCKWLCSEFGTYPGRHPNSDVLPSLGQNSLNRGGCTGDTPVSG